MFVYFFKELISFMGSLDKCHTSIFKALISFLKTLWEKKYAGNQHFLLFPQCFPSSSERILPLYSFILLSANAINSDWSKILSFGERLRKNLSLSFYPNVLSESLTHYHTILHFDALKIYSCRNSPFLTRFSTLYCVYFPF